MIAVTTKAIRFVINLLNPLKISLPEIILLDSVLQNLSLLLLQEFQNYSSSRIYQNCFFKQVET